MIEFILFCLASVGMTSIITQGRIFLPFRQFIGRRADKIHERREQVGKVPRWTFVEWFNDLINCAQCTGFWCGLFCGLFLVTSDRFMLAPISNSWFDSLWTRFDILYLHTLHGWNRLFMWFCCGLGGSFLSALGCNLIEWVFYRKMNALRYLEEQDMMLSERRANLPEKQE